MAITNTAKPTTSVTNIARVSFEQTWDNNTTTWDTEVRTWDDMGSLLDNTSRPTTTITNVAKPS